MTARMTSAERRNSVLKAALAEFAERGLDGTSTETIATRAGISQPYLFRLFSTKKELFLAVVDRTFDRIYDTFAGVSEGLSGDEALMAMGDSYKELLEDRQLLLCELHAYAACEDPDVRKATRAGFGRLWSLIEDRSGLPVERIRSFFATGMLMNVVAAMDLPRLDERWARACTTFSTGQEAT